MTRKPPPAPLRPIDRIHNYRCNTCGGKGHNAVTCGKTPAERRESRRGKKKP